MAEVLVGCILRKLQWLVVQTTGFGDELTRMESCFRRIKSFTGDAEKKQESNEAVSNWLEVVEDATYDVDDLLDDLWYAAIREKLSKLPKVWISFVSSGEKLLFFFILGPKIKKINEKLEDLVADGARLNFFELPRDFYPSNIRAVRLGVDQFLGREEEMNSLIKLLIHSNSDYASQNQNHLSIIALTGIGGIGKTTLAKLVYNNEQVSKHFELRVWVCLTAKACPHSILTKIAESVVRANLGKLDILQLQNILRRAMCGRRYLVVLDDVFDEESPDLKTLLMGLGGIPGSTILLTTRSMVVAKTMATVQPFALRGLDELESWDLFKHMAFATEEEQRDSGLLTIAKEIITKCAGLPLAIKTIGSLLYFENSESQWLMLDAELAKLQHTESYPLPALWLSYHHLPAHLKLCFAYFALFPEDCIFDVDSLIQLWMAEGFIESSDCGHSLEDIGNGYVMELLSRSFLEEVEKDEWGSITSFKLHDLIHDLAKAVAGTKIASLDSDATEVSKKARHISFSFDPNSSTQLPTLIHEPHKLRTFIGSQSWFSSRHRPILFYWNPIFRLLSSCKSLRVLNLQGIGMETVPGFLGDLTHLRCLDLSRNPLTSIPSSITRLLHLKTLKLSYCRLLKELPLGIENMVNLRHLELNGCDNLQYMPYGLGQLTSLQVLSRFVVTKGHNFISSCGSRLQELGRLNALRGNLEILHLENLEQLPDASKEAKAASLKEKPHLQFLALKWCWQDNDCGYNYNDEKLLEYLVPHQNLKDLFIRGYRGLRFPSWYSALTSLIKFTLHNCPGCKYLPPLHRLPFLKNLELIKLDSLEFVSDGDVNKEFPYPSMSNMTIFPSLKKLTLLDCHNLRSWWNMDTFNEASMSFSCISKLEIRYCPQLASIPRYCNLDEELILINVSMKLLQQTMMMTMPPRNVTTEEDPTNLAVQNSQSPAALSKLKSLHIANIEDLNTFPDEWVRNLTSLESLNISVCTRLKSLSHGIQHLSSLVSLKIKDCKELDFSAKEHDGVLWQGMSSLHSVTFWGSLKQKSLPLGLQYLTSLQFLQLYNCPDLVALPEWIGSLTSRNRIVISKCYNLASLPHGLRCLTSLHTLIIVDCPILLPRCQPKTGEDWQKIAHVSNFSVKPFQELESGN